MERELGRAGLANHARGITPNSVNGGDFFQPQTQILKCT